MGLKQTLELTHNLLTQKNIDHALIGGLALAVLGINRATADIDYLALAQDREQIKMEMLKIGFLLSAETKEVLHFTGLGSVDFLLAQRPISVQMLSNAHVSTLNGLKCLLPEDIIGLKIQAMKNEPKREFQDKADIQLIVEKFPQLDWDKIQKYAELFNVWDDIKKFKREK